MSLERTIALLAEAVGFASVSAASNLPIIGWAESHLRAQGFDCVRLLDATGEKAGLVARLGPAGPGGLVLSAHTDVVPADGAGWPQDPFRLTTKGTRLHGRGAADMKGFLAAMLALAERLRGRALARPLTLVLSYDEEVGCRGIAEMLPGVQARVAPPALCVVGEPTELAVALGHKGKAVYEVTCRGVPGHSAMAPLYCNALHIAADLVAILRRRQEALRLGAGAGEGYQIPYTTLHVGALSGGGPVNLVPEVARVLFEIRHLAGAPAAEIAEAIRADLAGAVAAMGHPAAGAEFAQVNAYPGLDMAADHPGIAALLDIAGGAPIRVDYGTEAGFFAGLGWPVAVCGPGSMAQGHQPDEFIETGELARCGALLDRLVERLLQ